MRISNPFARAETFTVPDLRALEADASLYCNQEVHADQSLAIARVLFGNLDDMITATVDLPHSAANPLFMRLTPLIDSVGKRELDDVPGLTDYSYQDWHFPLEKRRPYLKGALDNNSFKWWQLRRLNQSAVHSYRGITRAPEAMREVMRLDLAPELKTTLDTVRSMIP